MEPEDIRGLIEAIVNNRTEIETVIAGLAEYGPALKKFAMGVVLASCDFQIASIKKYEAAGFSHDDAIFLTLNSAFSVSESLKRAQAAKK